MNQDDHLEVDIADQNLALVLAQAQDLIPVMGLDGSHSILGLIFFKLSFMPFILCIKGYLKVA